MAFSYVQGGTALYRLNSSGTATALTLPTGVTIDSTRVGRFAIIGRQVVMVNSPSINLVIDPDGNVRPLVPQPPACPPIAAAGSATGLTGAFRVRESFLILDSDGNVYAESPLGPVSNSITLADQKLSVTGAALSPSSSVGARREYRTAASGTVYYALLDLDGNIQSAYVDATTDAALALLPASPDLGAPPGTLQNTYLEILCAWKNRLWAKGSIEGYQDRVFYTEEGLHYAWPADNYFDIQPVGRDKYGATAFIPRRDELGICKRDSIVKITGSSENDFSAIIVVQGTGCVAPDSVAVIRDVGYFLAEDGVYTFSSEGVRNISRDQVHPWFSTDTYFNRSRFPNAMGGWNPKYDTYELHLANAGDTTENRWVSYHIKEGIWLGPHKTGAFTPTCRALIKDSNDLHLPIIGGSDGFIYQMNQAAYTDGASTAIDMNVLTKAHSVNSPDIQKAWLQPSILSKDQASGTLTITPYVGDLDASAGATISHDLTTGRQKLRRLGRGRFAQLRFQQATNAVGCTLYGYECPFFEIGRR